MASLSAPERRLVLLLSALDGSAVPSTDLDDPASRLVTATITGDDPDEVLRDLATRHEDLIEVFESPAPTRSRVIAGLERLLWEP